MIDVRERRDGRAELTIDGVVYAIGAPDVLESARIFLEKKRSERLFDENKEDPAQPREIVSAQNADILKPLTLRKGVA